MAKPSRAVGVRRAKAKDQSPIDLRDVEIMKNWLMAFIVFALGTPAMADGTVPEEYQGVWAAARDCKENFQNIRSNVINRRSAVCRIMQIVSSSHPESHTNTFYLNCGGSRSREIWHSENIDDADYLVMVQFEQGAQGENPAVATYKRCPEIPLDEIPLSEIPGSPVADAASEEKIATPPRSVQIVRQRQFPHSRATRRRKRSPQ